MRSLVCVRVAGGELQPFDACAVELALRTGGEVTVLSLGPASAAEALRALGRLGVRRAVLLSDKCYAGSDTLATARILAAAAEKIGYDHIYCGRTTTEGETAQVGPMLATLLGLPLLSRVLSYAEGDLTLRGADTPVPLPEGKALLTVERSFPLRFPALRSRPGEVEIWDNDLLGLPQGICGLAGSPTRVLATRESHADTRTPVRMSVSDIPALLATLCQKEKRAAGEFPPSAEKLPCVAVPGMAALPAARAIGEKVLSLPCADAETLAARIREEDPDAVLFPADAWGRDMAPCVAAHLSAGLCADCTGLSVRDGQLLLTRPARGGSIQADIVCTTRPAMATVRCETQGAEIMLALGRGTLGLRERFLSLAARLSATPAATRALVDANGAPYAEQIGLTGAKASCKVYLAVGLSGAVQHTCALTGADTVIALNPDPDARIHTCADYSVLATAEEFLAAFGA